MKNIIFGISYYKIDKENEIIRQTKKMCLLYITSSRRFIELFTINGANFGIAISKEFIYYYSSKIILVDKYTRRISIAYIRDEAKIDKTRIKLSLHIRGSQDI